MTYANTAMTTIQKPVSMVTSPSWKAIDMPRAQVPEAHENRLTSRPHEQAAKTLRPDARHVHVMRASNVHGSLAGWRQADRAARAPSRKTASVKRAAAFGRTAKPPSVAKGS